MKHVNQTNQSQVKRVNRDTVGFMLSQGFSTDGNWYQWLKNQAQQTNGEAPPS
jgi:hypothetical protein